MEFTIASKVALLTGGAGGLGFEIAKTLLKQGLKGIAILDINENAGQRVLDALSKEFEPKSCLFIKTDVKEEAQVDSAFQQTIEAFSHLDLVINNAGVMSEMNWKKSVDVNLGGYITGTMLAMDKYLPKYKSGSEGVIVNIASSSGIQSIGQVPVYSATKHGIVGLSKAYSCPEHYFRSKVRVLVICPHGMKTNMIMNPTLDTYNIEYLKYFEHEDIIEQETTHVARSIANIITVGKNGSIWVVANNEPAYEVDMPVLNLKAKKQVLIEELL